MPIKTVSAAAIKKMLLSNKKLSLLTRLKVSWLKWLALFKLSFMVTRNRYPIINIKNNPLRGSLAKLCTEIIKFDLTRNVPKTAAMKL
mgnify:CR=1 FL=1